MYTQLVQALNAAQSPLDALALLEVKLCVCSGSTASHDLLQVHPMAIGLYASYMYNASHPLRSCQATGLASIQWCLLALQQTNQLSV